MTVARRVLFCSLAIFVLAAFTIPSSRNKPEKKVNITTLPHNGAFSLFTIYDGAQVGTTGFICSWVQPEIPPLPTFTVITVAPAIPKLTDSISSLLFVIPSVETVIATFGDEIRLSVTRWFGGIAAATVYVFAATLLVVFGLPRLQLDGSYGPFVTGCVRAFGGIGTSTGPIGGSYERLSKRPFRQLAISYLQVCAVSHRLVGDLAVS